MLWLNIAAFLFLFGVAVNAAIIHNRVGELEYSAGRIANYIQNKRKNKVDENLKICYYDLKYKLKKKVYIYESKKSYYSCSWVRY